MPRKRRSLVVADVLDVLKMADLEWARNGLIPSDKAVTGSLAEVQYTTMQYLDAYRGDFPDSMPGAVENVDEFVSNLIFSVANSLMAQMSSRDPEVIVRPSGGTAAEEDSWRRAWLNQKVAQAWLRQKKVKREVDRMLLSAVLLPFGMVRHGFTPDISEYENDQGQIIRRLKNETPDLPWTRAVMPWQVRIDPLVNNFDMDGEPGWIAFQNLYTKWQAQGDDAINWHEDWKPTFPMDMRPYHQRKTPITGRSSDLEKHQKNGDLTMLYEEWVFYDASRRTFFGVSPGSEKLVRDEKDWPFDWGQLPASILTLNEQLDSPFGIPFPQMVWKEQILTNRIWTIIQAIVNRTRRLIFVNGSAFSQNRGQLENLLSPDSLAEYIVSDSGASAADLINEVGTGSIDGQLLGLLFQLKESMREALGISSFDRGQRANVETAQEASSISEGGTVQKSRTLTKFEATYVNIIETGHRAILQVPNAQNFFIPLLGEENVAFLSQGEVAQGFLEVGVADLRGEFTFGIKQNSTTPLDPAAEFTRLSALYNAIGGPKASTANHVAFQKRLATLAGEDPELLIRSEEVTEEVGRQQLGEGVPGEDGGQPAGGADVPGLQGLVGGAS